MENLAQIAARLEVLRAKLNEELESTNCSENTSEKILQLSREVDLLVVEYQKLLNKE